MTLLEDSQVEIVIEWPARTPDRYEWFAATGSIGLVHASKSPPPEHYGCVPSALSPGDGELLDVFLLDAGARSPGDRLRARLIGVLIRSDGDHKLLAVDPTTSGTSHVAEVPAERIEAIWAWMRRHVRLTAAGPDQARVVCEDARRAWHLVKER